MQCEWFVGKAIGGVYEKMMPDSVNDRYTGVLDECNFYHKLKQIQNDERDRLDKVKETKCLSKSMT